jgi:hypothetical protein
MRRRKRTVNRPRPLARPAPCPNPACESGFLIELVNGVRRARRCPTCKPLPIVLPSKRVQNRQRRALQAWLFPKRDPKTAALGDRE